MRIDEGKFLPVPLCSPSIPHDLSWDSTRAAAVVSRRLRHGLWHDLWESLTEQHCPVCPSVRLFLHSAVDMSWHYFSDVCETRHEWHAVACRPVLASLCSVTCQYGMTRPQVAVGGDVVQIWKVVANMLNKQSPAVDKGWSFALRVVRGLMTHHRKTLSCYKLLHRASGPS
jgi:hypothetical protein